MVYCGKPSKGCSHCRERKIRCDQREPGCGQCDKRQQQCPGYRNLVDLMFRDESSHVIKKAKAKARRKGGSSPEPGGGSSTPDSASSTAAVSPEPQQHQFFHHQQPLPNQKDAQQRLLKPRAIQQKRKRAKLSLQTPATGSLVLQGDDHESLLPSPDAGSWPKTPMIAVWYTLNPTCQEKGTAYFFSRYVAIDENACHQRFDFIYDIWRPGGLVPEHQVDSVMASMTAVGLVGLANMTRSREVMEDARKSYGTALRLINAALAEPREAVRDTTMLSILILGLFEMTTDATPRTMKAWQEHINGAAELARMRGPAQFRTRAGTKMFMMLCQSVMISCIQQELPMPPSLVDLREELVRQLGNVDKNASLGSPESNSGDGVVEAVAPTQASIEVAMPIYRVLQFRNDFKSGLFSDREAVIERLIEMDDEFARAAAAMPESWRYRVLRVTRPHKAVWNGTCHVYPTLSKAAVWNGIRACRLLILETVLAELHAHFCDVGDPALVPRRYIEQFHASRQRLESMCGAILASVPQHSGLLAGSDVFFSPSEPSSKPSSNRPCSSARPPFNSPLRTSPISTVEVRAPATPPQSPESTTSSASSSMSSSASSCGDPESPAAATRVVDDCGPTLLDPTRASTPEEEAQRFMLLASASHTIVWPLYHVGMSSICSPSMKTYCIERLEAIFKETGLSQASAIATIVQNRDVVPRWREVERLFPLPALPGLCWGGG